MIGSSSWMAVLGNPLLMASSTFFHCASRVAPHANDPRVKKEIEATKSDFIIVPCLLLFITLHGSARVNVHSLIRREKSVFAPGSDAYKSCLFKRAFLPLATDRQSAQTET